MSAPPPLPILGQLDGNGILSVHAAVRDMDPGLESVTLYFQSIFRGDECSLSMGSISTMVLIDESF